VSEKDPRTWMQSFAAYACVTLSFIEPDIDFDVPQPRLGNELTSIIEGSINYHYRSEPPLCGSCAEEGGNA
jgi:hypothetical protein